MRRSIVGALTLILAGVPTATAQTAATDSTRPAIKASAGQLKLAGELLPLMNTEAVLRSSIEQAFDEQVKAQPLMAPFRATMQQWALKYFTYTELVGSLTQIYAEEFTEPELKQLIAFYRTPVGAKAAALAPSLSRRGGEAGRKIAEAHFAELQEMIQKRAAELQASPPPG